MIAAVTLAESQVIPKNPGASFASFPRQASVRSKGEALAAQWEREQPADLLPPLVTEEEAKTARGTPASTARGAGMALLETLKG
ncbi:hypothetical protein [uncultured Stenotrophomonas sp.]|uniref:hypothetical protein n=1 Tax=uncultured Stenotrophomonas sp. TaxID=165438 RepID=UPI0028EDE498|nr:hypothetical protein [uncultured Stenotrophomonas sp.]